jgi:hypothetical protein
VHPGAYAREIARVLREVAAVFDALGREEGHGHGQVVAGAFLTQVSRGQVDRDAAHRHVTPNITG